MSEPGPRGRGKVGVRELAIVGSIMVGVAVLATWPLARSPADRSLAAPAAADPLLNQYLLVWPIHAWTTPGADLYHANIFHPEPYTFAYSDMMLSSSLLVAPIVLAGGSPNLANNLLLLASLLIGGIGMHVLIRRLGLPVFAGVTGAILYAVNPAHMARTHHVQLFADHWLPWLILASLAWLASCGLRDGPPAGGRPPSVMRAALVAVLFALHALSGSHNAVFGALVVGILVGAHGTAYWLRRGSTGEPATSRRREARWRSLVGIAVAAGMVLLILAPAFYPYLVVYENLAAGRLGSSDNEMAVIVGGSAGLKELLTGGSLFWQRVERATGWPGEWVAADRPLRAHLFPGLVLIGLALIGTWSLAPRRAPRPRTLLAWTLDLTAMATALGAVAVAITGSYSWNLLGARIDLSSVLLPAVICIAATVARRLVGGEEPHLLEGLAGALRRRWRTSRDRLLWATLVLVCLLLAAGPEGGLYLLLRNLPGIGLIRAPSRFVLPGLVALAALAAFGITDLRRRLPTRVAVAAGVALLLVFAAEARVAPLRLGPVPYPADRLSYWLASRPGDFTILEVPVDISPPAAVRQMLRSTVHWKRLLIGYSGSAPPGYLERMEWLRTHVPAPPALARLRELDVRYLVLDTRLAEPALVAEFERAPGLRLVERFGHRRVYELLA